MTDPFGECKCAAQYTIEPHGEGYALYYGRCGHRIWKFDTKTNRIVEVYNIREGKPQVNRAEFMKIQLMANPVQYSDYYLSMEQAKEWREQREAKKSSTVD